MDEEAVGLGKAHHCLLDHLAGGAGLHSAETDDDGHGNHSGNGTNAYCLPERATARCGRFERE